MKLLKIQCISDQVVLFMRQYGYNQKMMSKELDIAAYTFSRRIITDEWLFDEIRALKRIFKKHNVFLRDASSLIDIDGIELVYSAIYYGFSINESQLKSKSRKRELVEARMFVSNFMKQSSNMSLSKIGEFTNSDHATVLNHLKKYKDYCETDPKFKEKADRFRKWITNLKLNKV